MGCARGGGRFANAAGPAPALLHDSETKRQSFGVKMCGHTSGIADMKFSPNGKLLTHSAWDGTVRIWEIPSGRQLLVLDADVYRVSSIAFLPDGGVVTANWNGTVHLWDLSKHLETDKAPALAD